MLGCDEKRRVEEIIDFKESRKYFEIGARLPGVLIGPQEQVKLY